MRPEEKDYYTPSVRARADLAEALEKMGPVWLKTKRLKLSDVRVIFTQGRTAQEADREQQEQIAEQKVGRKGRSGNAADVMRRERELADTVTAVIGDLAANGHEDLASFLAKLTFSRFRIRVTSVPVESGESSSEETKAEVKTVERVEKSDLASRADGLAAFCAALQKKGREPIMAELAERGIDPEWLTTLGADAEVVAEQGRNALRPAEATAREAAAVLAQNAKWSAVRRLFKRAVAGDRELEALYAAC